MFRADVKNAEISENLQQVLGVQHVEADTFVTETTLISIGFLMQDTISAISNTVPETNTYLFDAVSLANDGVMSLIEQLCELFE